jgi:hypothetical protein
MMRPLLRRCQLRALLLAQGFQRAGRKGEADEDATDLMPRRGET